MKPAEYHSEAATEIEEAAPYYESKVEGLGTEYVREVIRCVELIREFPGLGSQFEDTPFRHFVTRRFPFAIYYAVLPELIWIVAVAHGKRKPGYWRERRIDPAP